VSVFDLRDDDFEHISDLLRRIDEARKRRDDRFSRESDQFLREQALSPKSDGKRKVRFGPLGGSGEYLSALDEGMLVEGGG
jgi:hypothetical protein